jgi:hypothetical protein
VLPPVGSVGDVLLMSSCEEMPRNSAMPGGGTNEANIGNVVPVFELHANDADEAPLVPQSFHARFRPSAAASEVASASMRPAMGRDFFIFCLQDAYSSKKGKDLLG